MARRVYRVMPSESRWELKRLGVLLYNNDDKLAVVAQGQATAQANLPSHLFVHRADGTIEREYTYGDEMVV